MHFITSNTFALITVLANVLQISASPTSCNVNGNKYKVDSVITRDITIIGGGSAGTYSAIRLYDSGKSIVVIEASDRLGGHTQTFIEPNTGVPIDYGVQVFHNIPEVRDYFNRLSVSYSTLGFEAIPGVTDEYIDFTTGTTNLTYIPGGELNAFSQALQTYGTQVYQYPYLDFGYSLPTPIPEELYMPFGKFVKEHGLDAMVPFAWKFTQGLGDLLKAPTIYVFKLLGIADLESLQEGFLTTTQHHNSLIYLSAQAILGSNVLYSSTVVDVERDDKDGVSVIVRKGGKLTLIKSKKLIIAIQPTPDNLRPVDLTDREQDLFRKFKYTNYFTGILKNTGIPDNTSFTSYSPSRPYNIPALPSLYTLSQTGFPGLLQAYFISKDDMSDADIKALIISQINNIKVPGKVHGNPEFVVSDSHKPFQLQVSSESIKAGFYKDLLALQGRKRTWYISATFHAHDSSLIWRYAESLFSAIIE